MNDAEAIRLAEDTRRERNWKRWGPYLAERQWGTVREDYSPHGECWGYFPHDHARRRAYRWGEDGLLGFTDREGRLCFALALWNGADPILKERLFGLTGPEGNHGEDVKECYYYLDATPDALVQQGALQVSATRVSVRGAASRRTAGAASTSRSTSSSDTGAFDDDRYFDVTAEYAKGGPDDVLIRDHGREPRARTRRRCTCCRRCGSATRGAGVASARSTGPNRRSSLDRPSRPSRITGRSARSSSSADRASNGAEPSWLFTENDTNVARLFGSPNAQPYVKDAFHEYVIRRPSRRGEPRNDGHEGRRALRARAVAPGESATICLRLTERRRPRRRVVVRP